MHGEESVPQGLKAKEFLSRDVRAKARTYPAVSFSAANQALVICGFYGPT